METKGSVTLASTISPLVEYQAFAEQILASAKIEDYTKANEYIKSVIDAYSQEKWMAIQQYADSRSPKDFVAKIVSHVVQAYLSSEKCSLTVEEAIRKEDALRIVTMQKKLSQFADACDMDSAHHYVEKLDPRYQGGAVRVLAALHVIVKNNPTAGWLLDFLHKNNKEGYLALKDDLQKLSCLDVINKPSFEKIFEDIKVALAPVVSQVNEEYSVNLGVFKIKSAFIENRLKNGATKVIFDLLGDHWCTLKELRDLQNKAAPTTILDALIYDCLEALILKKAKLLIDIGYLTELAKEISFCSSEIQIKILPLLCERALDLNRGGIIFLFIKDLPFGKIRSSVVEICTKKMNQFDLIALRKLYEKAYSEWSGTAIEVFIDPDLKKITQSIHLTDKELSSLKDV